MSAEIIDGKAISKSYREDIKQEVSRLKEQNIVPGLAVVIVGEDPASLTYVNAKHKACQAAGLHSEIIRLPQDVEQQELLEHVHSLNVNPDINGILVQLPLPEHISEQAVIETIAPEKDVDGFHPINVGNLVIGKKAFLPCTPHGILKMIRKTGVKIEGKHVVVVGRSNIVGKPVSLLFLQEHATVTICHSRTRDLAEKTRSADILIVAAGRPHMIGKEHVQDGAVVIDVGIHRNDDNRLIGDVDFEAVQEVAGYITPVPGGVGPMTITMLLWNTVEAAKMHAETSDL
jgi:methylenetetrahydrofolate dehydrogenase (NADP+) / methenyltetrahydrofolate cyclohydrolase